MHVLFCLSGLQDNMQIALLFICTPITTIMILYSGILQIPDGECAVTTVMLKLYAIHVMVDVYVTLVLHLLFPVLFCIPSHV